VLAIKDFERGKDVLNREAVFSGELQMLGGFLRRRGTGPWSR